MFIEKTIVWYSTPNGVAPIVDAIFYKHENPPGLKLKYLMLKVSTILATFSGYFAYSYQQ